MEKKRFFDKSFLKFWGLNILLAVVVGLLVLTGLYFWLRSYTQHGVEVEVKDVRGMVVPEAETILAAQELQLVVIDSTYTDRVPFGTIVEQDPKPMSHAKHGRSVYVTINATTKRQVSIPNLQDMSYRQAETTLRGLGIKVDTVYDYRPSEYRDLVLDVKRNGVSVTPGTKLPVGSKVRLVVGKGRGTETVRVPNVVGMTLQEARAQLLQCQLTVGAMTYDEPDLKEETQYVYRQTPGVGTMMLEGETVSLKLSTNPEKAAKGGNAAEAEDEWF